MPRRDRVVLGTALMVIGATVGAAWLFGHKSEKLPFWPVWVFVTVFVLGVASVMSSGRSGMEPEHAANLRQIAGRVANDNPEPYGTPQARQMFEAHYRRTVQLSAVRSETGMAEENAWTALAREVNVSAHERFPQSDLWQIGGIVTVARATLKDKDARVKVTREQFRHGQAWTMGRMSPPQVSWGSHIVWWALEATPEAEITDGALESRIDAIRAWYGEMSVSQEAVVYRDAIWNTRARRNELDGEMAPLMHGAAIRWSHKCLICRPRKWWEFWR